MIDFICGIFGFIWEIVSALWMGPVHIFKAINPITFLYVDTIVAHFLTFCLYFIVVGVALKKMSK